MDSGVGNKRSLNQTSMGADTRSPRDAHCTKNILSEKNEIQSSGSKRNLEIQPSSLTLRRKWRRR
eukprot:scaffold7262_cov149-Ochromonas_danica.AAC.1